MRSFLFIAPMIIAVGCHRQDRYSDQTPTTTTQVQPGGSDQSGMTDNQNKWKNQPNQAATQTGMSDRNNNVIGSNKMAMTCKIDTDCGDQESPACAPPAWTSPRTWPSAPTPGSSSTPIRVDIWSDREAAPRSDQPLSEVGPVSPREYRREHRLERHCRLQPEAGRSSSYCGGQLSHGPGRVPGPAPYGELRGRQPAVLRSGPGLHGEESPRLHQEDAQQHRQHEEQRLANVAAGGATRSWADLFAGPRPAHSH